MNRKMTPLAIALVVISLIAVLHAPNAQADNCTNDWSACRSAATTAFFNDEVGVIRYSLMLDVCDIGYAMCVLNPV
jgi:hypothetical protein